MLTRSQIIRSPSKLSFKSPVHKPLFEQEPFLNLGGVHVHVSIKTAHHENLVVVVDGVGAEELLRLLQGTVLSFNLIRLRVKREAIRNPSLVTSEYQNFRVAVGEGAHGVSGGPGAVLVDELQRFPLLLVQVCIAVQPFK